MDNDVPMAIGARFRTSQRIDRCRFVVFLAKLGEDWVLVVWDIIWEIFHLVLTEPIVLLLLVPRSVPSAGSLLYY
jgi:hypothetical protein